MGEHAILWWSGDGQLIPRVGHPDQVATSDRAALNRWEAIDTALLHELNRQEVEALLGRARAEGVRGLSEVERAFLDRMATRH